MEEGLLHDPAALRTWQPNAGSACHGLAPTTGKQRNPHTQWVDQIQVAPHDDEFSEDNAAFITAAKIIRHLFGCLGHSF
jgi:hypothetical protein